MNRSVMMTLALLLAGCTAATIHDKTMTQYVNAAFTAEGLKSGGLAMFPVTAAEGQEGYRRPLGDSMSDSLGVAVPGGKTLIWQATMDSLNAYNKVQVYQDLVATYHQASIVDKQRARELGDALHVRYGLFCSLQKYSSEEHASYSIWSGWANEHSSEVVAHCLIIDMQNGDVMQEIFGNASSQGDDYTYESSYEAYAKVVARSILSQLPGSGLQRATVTTKKKPQGPHLY